MNKAKDLKLTFIDARSSKSQMVKIDVGLYFTKKSICLRLFTCDDGNFSEPWLCATTWMPDYNIQKSQVFIKDYSENAGIASLLAENGIIETDPVDHFAGIPVFSLTPAMMEHILSLPYINGKFSFEDNDAPSIAP